jgi:phenylacetic acid degradation operon negative regulatory protein
MVGAGDLVRSADGYRLSDRLLARQRRQDDALDPQLRRWDGTWSTLVITSVGTDARTRATLRTTLHGKRFGELREGVWMRPANLDLQLTDELRGRVRVLEARDGDPAGLVALVLEELDRERTAQGLVDRHPDGSHRPLAQRLEESVFAPNDVACAWHRPHLTWVA